MTEWYDKNYTSPYPTFRDCEQMANDGCITISQVKQWFVNVRRRTQNKFRIKREKNLNKDETNEQYFYNQYNYNNEPITPCFNSYNNYSYNQTTPSNILYSYNNNTSSISPSSFNSSINLSSPSSFYSNQSSINYSPNQFLQMSYSNIDSSFNSSYGINNNGYF